MGLVGAIAYRLSRLWNVERLCRGMRLARNVEYNVSATLQDNQLKHVRIIPSGIQAASGAPDYRDSRNAQIP